jgi:hypothetical protein
MPNPSVVRMSQEAEKLIAERLRFQESRIPDKSLVPALCLIYKERIYDGSGRTIEFYERPFVDVGWYPAEVPVADGFVEATVAGQVMFVAPDLIQELEHNRLVVAAVSSKNSEARRLVLETHESGQTNTPGEVSEEPPR